MGRMKFRKLRIAFSAVCGVFCLLLIVLWVRSYWALDVFVANLPTATAVQSVSTNGRLYLHSFPASVDATWSWASLTDSQIDAAMNKRLGLLETNIFPPLSKQLARLFASSIREQTRQRLIARMTGITKWPLESATSATYLGFACKRHATGWSLVCPHWFPALISGFMAIFVGTRPRLRFSLRTLLIATTLVAVVLGLIVWLR
jgi:hypothetical protein